MESEAVRWTPSQLVLGAVVHADQPITNLCFHRNGQYLISTTDNSVILTDSLSGKEKKRINCKTHGVGRAAYTHHDACIIVSGDRKQFDIRYLCLYDNRYIRSYEGHSGRVSSLSMCPSDDHFLSASDTGPDPCVLMWDLNVSNPVAKLPLPSGAEHARVAYDDSGLIFGVMTATGNAHSIKLYDARNYGKGPFQDLAPQNVKSRPGPGMGYSASSQSLMDVALRRAYMDLNSRAAAAGGGTVFSAPNQSQSFSVQASVDRHRSADVVWNDLQFNLDGSQVLVNCSVNGGSAGDLRLSSGEDLGVNTSSAAVLVLDGFKSDVEPAVILRRKGSGAGAAAARELANMSSSKSSTKNATKALGLGACFSTDSRYVLVGNEDNEINSYEITAAGTAVGVSADNNNAISCQHMSTLLGHTSPVGCIAPNPKYDVIASACITTALWVHNSNSST
jgi:WD40 repeat protein